MSKSVGVDRLAAAMAAGVRLFGENRVQEAEGKVPQLPGARWHMVGHLQSNKAARAAALFDAVHSLDSIALARRLDRLVVDAGRAPLAVYLQVNVDRDTAKEGLTPEETDAVLHEVVALPGLDVLGLMTVGRLVATPSQARSTFASLRDLSSRLRARWPRLGSGLSMGMSDDFEPAVEEGATVLRIGRALFGERPTGVR